LSYVGEQSLAIPIMQDAERLVMTTPEQGQKLLVLV